MWPPLLLISTILGLLAPALGSQIPFNAESNAEQLRVTPIHLNSISNTFTTLEHPAFPAHQVRIKRTDFCDPVVKVWTDNLVGYIDVDYGAKHLFFYFFESRRNPDTDDVVMWINGGPGCSASTGLLMELGIELCFLYDGIYLPVFAAEIYDQNKKRPEGVPINLSSVLIGNGITDISTLYPARYQATCGRTSVDTPVLDVNVCTRMQKALPRCQRMLRESCINLFDEMDCATASRFCDNELSVPFWSTGRNVYDISKMCIGDNHCYLERSQILNLFNQQSVRDNLGIPSTVGNFTGCNPAVGQAFAKHLDMWRLPAQFYVANLLERGIRILIYAGTYDWQCNWLANWLWSDKLEWSGGNDFRTQTMRDWTLPGKIAIAGQTRTARNLTFTTIYAAGHMVSVPAMSLVMVPHDKPKESLHMFQGWLEEQDL
ncbi:hypothetical protein M422DRAFT_71784 [Sphaerobolus stellatus SS14]|uniref:carboxypeptidase C n=1 Tax=Sphaerobolus stellatus (strain SS14) TaxID=990650 RepID=A0A0C9UNZ0_SPHS4|nr:hypothetical protein M422DRAFT_71784 [Sphaerobolus stellatus SS14]